MATVEAPHILRFPRVLVASSNDAFRRVWINHPDKAVQEATGGADALAKLESQEWEEVLIDRRLPDLDAGEVVRLIRTKHPQLIVRMVDSEIAIQECELDVSASDLPVKRPSPGPNEPSHPCDPQNANQSPWDTVLRPHIVPLPGMIGHGPRLAEVFRLAHLVGPRRTSVLVTGETGTGKELVARGIHQISPRAQNPFVVVNCAAIPEQLLESELFGYVRGAFSGAAQSRLGRIHCAHSGTLFLDEVGDLPLSMQAKLLRFLQDGEIQRLGSSDVFRVDVRVVSATNLHLSRHVQEKLFRQDLYYRLAVFPLEVPPLRERREDIPALAEHFLNALAENADEAPKRLSAAAAVVLRQFQWPGNVRELQHAIERAYILSQDERELRPTHFTYSGDVATSE